MEFKEFRTLLQKNFEELTKDASHLFEVELDKDFLWDLYLNSFPEGTNEIFRTRREFDGSYDRSFVRSFGNVVTIKNNQVKTIWDFETNDGKFQPVLNALNEFVLSKAVADVYISKLKKIGVERNFEQTDEGKTIEWNHFYLELPNQFVDNSSKSVAEIQGGYRDTRNVFKRSLDEITEESLLTVLELISQNSLYKGEEWKSVLTEFLKFKKAYAKLQTVKEKGNYTWEQSVKVGGAIGRIRNHSIGTLLLNISEEMDLDEAVRKYEVIVAPHNYKRSKPIYSQKMLDAAKQKIEELGYMESLNRRYAVLDDITVNDILFSDKDSAKRISGNVFDEMAKETSLSAKSFSKVEEISITNFIENVLPTATKVEAFLENKHSDNMASLIAPVNKKSKTMFKWPNNFSWSYAGNITDSDMKQNVKAAGGNVEGVLRFSIQWNDGNGHDGNDLDAHCHEPNGNHIYYGDKNNVYTTGQLDVDIQLPERNKPAVENIVWLNKTKMQEGVYRFFVNNYANRGGKGGFKAEIEFNGEIYSFDYGKEVRQGESVHVAEVTLANGEFSIKEKFPSSVSSKELWNLQTNQFVPVSVICYSPNYWSEQQSGHKHYMFMMKGCINPQQPNGFFNEFLNHELFEHRKVMEALGSKLRVEDSVDQLSGLGFSSTKRNELIVRVEGHTKRMFKVKF